MLPSVKINFANGTLGGVEAMDDGVCLMLVSGLSSDIVCQNIEDYRKQIGTQTEDEKVVAFYHQVGGNAKLILSTTALEETALKNKIAEYRGEIRFVVADEINSITTVKLLDSVAKYATETLFAPCFFLVSCTSSLLEDTADWSVHNVSRVAVVDNVEAEGEIPLLYYVAGRLASVPVQRSLARVKDGALYPPAFYTTDGAPVDNLHATTAHEKGLITVRTFVGKTGYYIADDQMAVPVSDDYAYIPRRRTIDKAYRITYATLVNYIGEEIPLQEGKIPPATCMDIQNAVEQAIVSSMTEAGNLGTADPTDKGVVCFVDPDQDIAKTSKLEVSVKVKPYGYSKYIEVLLGFDTQI
ncbi:MAG: DUF2586 domain-containing protein [Bacteroidales bacterium]|nr:DUF2586 domain-containing protein [Bacteroidales bacterium]